MASPRIVDFNELETLVGEEIGVSDWVVIDQERVNKFAEATGDFQWIHVDVERATKEIGSPIAHGFLTLSILPLLSPQVLKVESVSRGINYGTNKVRFTNMVPVGSRIRLNQKCLSVEPKSGGRQMISQNTIEIEGQDRPAMVSENISVLYGY